MNVQKKSTNISFTGKVTDNLREVTLPLTADSRSLSYHVILITDCV